MNVERAIIYIQKVNYPFRDGWRIQSFVHVHYNKKRENMSSRFSSNSEGVASE